MKGHGRQLAFGQAADRSGSHVIVGPGIALAALTLLVSPDAGAQRIERAPAFDGDDLAAPPTDGWPTNGGDWYNRRYLPLACFRSVEYTSFPFSAI
jgi:hypothetical protein